METIKQNGMFLERQQLNEIQAKAGARKVLDFSIKLAIHHIDLLGGSSQDS